MRSCVLILTLLWTEHKASHTLSNAPLLACNPSPLSPLAVGGRLSCPAGPEWILVHMQVWNLWSTSLALEVAWIAACTPPGPTNWSIFKELPSYVVDNKAIERGTILWYRNVVTYGLLVFFFFFSSSALIIEWDEDIAHAAQIHCFPPSLLWSFPVCMWNNMGVVGTLKLCYYLCAIMGSELCLHLLWLSLFCFL